MAHSFSKRISGTTPYYNFIRKVAFPSTRVILASSLLYTTVGIGIAFLIAEQSLSSFLTGAIWGVTMFTLPSFASTIVLNYAIVGDDPLFYFRRCLAFSLFTNIVWVVIFVVCSIISLTIHTLIFPNFAFIVGLFIVIPLRAVTVFSMSRISFLKRTLFTLIEPTMTGVLVSVLFKIPWDIVATALILSSLVGLTFAFGLITIVETYGRKIIGFSPIRMFRSFLIDWLEGKNDELESYLSELGIQTEIDVAAYVFRRKSTNQIKSIMLVSNFHPGPFLNVGSSVLPFLFQTAMRKRLDAVGMVPHGVSGHELNLVSQEQNAKIIEWVIESIPNLSYSDHATPVIRVNNEIATATSQIFDGCALVTMTTSPHDMEDVPSEVMNRITGLTKGKFRHVGLIDAHNCLTGPTTMTSEKVGGLEDAALASLQISAQQQGVSFSVGGSTRHPSQFTLRDGLGAGGISVIVVEVSGHRFAYINIDGNNMIKGLREIIIEKVKKLGFEDCEVLTSDTHMVNGLVSARLGYHPVGEAVSEVSLVREIEVACEAALKDLEPSEVAVVSDQVTLTTLGSKSLKHLMSVVYKISRMTALAMFVAIISVATISLLMLV
ncbi:MAG: DUF2070 family protein [Candidatus Bathyarchaeia archaeon]